MKFLRIAFFMIILLALFNRCNTISADEVSRFSVNKFSVGEDYKIYESNKISMKTGEKVFIWSKLDLEYKGELDIGFQVQLFNEKDENLMLIEFNPIEPKMKIMCVNSYAGDVGKYSCTGLSDFHLPEGNKNDFFRFIEIPDEGDYYFRAILFSKTNAVITLNNAELIIKK